MGLLSVISHKFIAALRAPLLVLMVCAGVVRCQTMATSVPLLLPTNIAVDAQGNLYIAETGRHLVRRVDVRGQITTIAGSGMQGFDGGNFRPAQYGEKDISTSTLHRPLPYLCLNSARSRSIPFHPAPPWSCSESTIHVASTTTAFIRCAIRRLS